MRMSYLHGWRNKGIDDYDILYWIEEKVSKAIYVQTPLNCINAF